MSKQDTILHILNSQADEGPGCEGGRDFRFPIGHFDQAMLMSAFTVFLASERAQQSGIERIDYQGRQHGDEVYFVRWAA